MTNEPGSVGAAADEGKYVIPLGDVFRVIWKRLWLVVLAMVLLAGAAVGLSLTQTPGYEASIKILVGQQQGITENPNDVAGLQQLTQTMAEAVKSRPVAQDVIQQLGLGITPEDLLNNLSVKQIAATQFVQVGYKDTDPQRAQLVADTVGDVFSRRVSETSTNTNPVTATVWERATMPGNPVSPNFVLNVALALALGVVLGVGLAFLLEYVDDSWRSPEETEQVSGVPTFGVIPSFEVSKNPTPKGKKKGGIGVFSSDGSSGAGGR